MKSQGIPSVWVVFMALSLMIFAGCVTSMYPLPSTLDELKALGYTQTKMFGTTPSGERRESTHYDIWFKEFRDKGRIAHFCLVPRGGTGIGYNWEVIVSIDDRQVWEYQSHPLGSAAVRQSGISCAESPQLPEGRLNYSTRYTYWS